MITTTVAAEDVREGDVLYVAGDRITVGRRRRLRATRTNRARMAFYPLRPDGTVDPCRAAVWSVTKKVRLDPTSPSIAQKERA
jgi:hypothetical protein